MFNIGNSSNCLSLDSNTCQQVMSPGALTAALNVLALCCDTLFASAQFRFTGFSSGCFYAIHQLLIIYIFHHLASIYSDPYDLTYVTIIFSSVILLSSNKLSTSFKSYVHTTLLPIDIILAQLSRTLTNFFSFANLIYQQNGTHLGLIAMADKVNLTRDTWVMDTGCTMHVCCQKELFTELTHERGRTLSGIAGSIELSGRGTVQIGNNTIYNVAYAPKMPFNLFSVSQSIALNGNTFVFNRTSVIVVTPEGTRSKCGTAKKGLYIFDFGRPSDASILAAPAFNYYLHSFGIEIDSIPSGNQPHVRKAISLYNRLGQPGARLYNKLVPIIHAPPLKIPDTFPCRECKSKSASTKRVVRPLQLLEVFYFKDTQLDSHTAHGTWIFVQDHFSKYTIASHVNNVSETSTRLMQMLDSFQEDSKGRGNSFNIDRVRTPNMAVFDDPILHEFFKSKTIVHEYRASYTPLKNIDSYYFTQIQKMATSMLQRAQAPASLWVDALQSAVFLLNRLPIAGKNSGIPYCLYTNIPASEFSIHNLHIFGCAVKARPPSNYIKSRGVISSTKSDTISGVFVGYVPEIRGYKVYDYLANKSFTTRELEFDERTFPMSSAMSIQKATDSNVSSPRKSHKLPQHSNEPKSLQTASKTNHTSISTFAYTQPRNGNKTSPRHNKMSKPRTLNAHSEVPHHVQPTESMLAPYVSPATTDIFLNNSAFSEDITAVNSDTSSSTAISVHSTDSMGDTTTKHSSDISNSAKALKMTDLEPRSADFPVIPTTNKDYTSPPSPCSSSTTLRTDMETPFLDSPESPPEETSQYANGHSHLNDHAISVFAPAPLFTEIPISSSENPRDSSLFLIQEQPSEHPKDESPPHRSYDEW